MRMIRDKDSVCCQDVCTDSNFANASNVIHVANAASIPDGELRNYGFALLQCDQKRKPADDHVHSDLNIMNVSQPHRLNDFRSFPNVSPKKTVVILRFKQPIKLADSLDLFQPWRGPEHPELLDQRHIVNCPGNSG